MAYAVKFASKRELGRDYVVMPLEGLWWAQAMDAFTTARDKSRWDWTMMTMVPDWIDRDLVEAVVPRVAARHRPARLDDVRLETLAEGLCVQTLHVGRHHEIYLNDARRTAPGRLRTILRQPVERTDPSGA